MGDEYQSAYGITYAPEKPFGPREFQFPVYFSRTGLETMLYALQWLAQTHQSVDEMLRQEIHRDTYLSEDTNMPPDSFPLLPFIRSLAGMANVDTITWNTPDLMVSDRPTGMEVKGYFESYFFPNEHFFHQLFFEAIGGYDHDPAAMYGYLHFCEWMEGADYDLCEILSPYKTVFIDEEVVPVVLRKLSVLFARIEDLLGEKLFVWKIGPAPHPFLAEIIEQGFERMNNKYCITDNRAR